MTTNTDNKHAVKSTEETARTVVVTPIADVYSEGGKLVVEAEMPGLSKENIEAHMENQVLSISAQQQKIKAKRGHKWRIKFERKFHLNGHYDVNQIEAKYGDGILKVFIPKKDEETAKKLSIA